MAQATTAKSTSETQSAPVRPVPARFAKNGGKIAIIWRPENDSGVLRPPLGAKSDRPFIFEWVDRAEIEKKKREREEMDILKAQMINPLPIKGDTLRLEPGLNWVEKDKWDKALAESKARYESEEYAIDEDHIDRLIRDQAIRQLRTKGENLTGTIVDYALNEAKAIIDSVNDLNTLMDFQAQSTDTALTQAIIQRIERLQGKF